MKVLHILNEIRFSGAETMLASAAGLWKKDGLELYALATSDVEGAFADILRKNGYKVIHIPYRKTIKLVWDIYKLFRKEDFYVVHIHPERGYFQYALASWMARTSIKIRTVHHIYSYKNMNVIRPLVLRYVSKYIFGVQFVSNSLSGQANEKRLFGLNHLYIPNWIDSCVYNRVAIEMNQDNGLRKRLGIADDQILLVSLGGNTDYKNYDRVIEALGSDELRSRYVYMHLGHDDRHELIPLAKKHQVDYKSMGCVENTIPYLLSADLVMMPSREEGFGIAAVESMAIGVPICLSLRPALIDFKQSTDKLFWCEPTVEGIREFLRDFQKLSESERKTISGSLMSGADKFTIERGASAYLQLYKRKAK